MKRTALSRKSPLARKSGLARKTAALRAVSAAPGRSGPGIGGRTSGKIRPGDRLRTRRRSRPVEPGETEWKKPRSGRCSVCRVRGPLVLHHVLTEAKIRWYATDAQIAAGICWDQANALAIGAPVPWGGRCRCHDDHHRRGIEDRRIPLDLVPDRAIAYAVDLLGEDAAVEYFKRYYKPTEGSRSVSV